MKYPIGRWATLWSRLWAVLALIILLVVVYYVVFLSGPRGVEPLRNVDSPSPGLASPT